MTTRLEAVATTYIKAGHPRENFGTQTILRIRESGDNRGLVRFDQAAITSTVGTPGNLVSAKLELTIADNGNNWGPSGRTVGAYRMSTAWSGLGATFHCAIDTNTANQQDDCSGPTAWEMGAPQHPELHPWVEPATGTVLITNGLAGVVQIDVKADVLAFLAGTHPNLGWLLKKVEENQAGRVDFASMETATPPELVLVVDGAPPPPGCDGVPGSGKVLDACGLCDGDGSSCAGCDGVPNSGKVLDACGVCDGDGSTCAGCDGVPNSGLVLDACGVCGGDGSSCAGCPGGPLPATGGGPDRRTVFVSSTCSLAQLAGEDSAVLREPATPAPRRALAADAARAVVWSYGAGRLMSHRVDTGAVVVSVLVPALQAEETAHPDSTPRMAVLPGDGSVWVAIESTLVRLDRLGQPQSSVTLPGPVVEVASDRIGQRILVTVADRVLAYDADGQQNGLIFSDSFIASAVDDVSGDVWVATSSGFLSRLTPQGGFSAGSIPEASSARLASDGQGRAWLALGSDLFHVGPEGTPGDNAIATGGDTSVIRELAADPTDGSVRVARHSTLHHVDAEDLVRVSLPLWGADFLAVTLWWDRTPPAVTLELAVAQPDPRRPAIAVSYTDVGVGVDPATLLFSRGGHSLPVSCTPAPGGGQTCMPTIDIRAGESAISATVADLLGNRSAPGSLTVNVPPDPPAPGDPPSPVIGDLVAARDLGGAVSRVAGAAAAAQGGSQVTVTNTRTGAMTTVIASADGSFSADVGGMVGDILQLSVHTGSGGDSLPTTVRVMQSGLLPEVIEGRRWATIRGVVRNREGAYLPGVAVTVKGAPEYGQGITNLAGTYELTVNGGGYVTLELSREGYLPAQRQVRTPWRDHATADETVMIPRDLAATVVDLSGGSTTVQVHQGSVTSDVDGTRRATVLVLPGTTATMVLPGGGTQAVTAGTMRVTEYTVGTQRGVMPAKLPPTSAYTYALEYELDEAVAAGATRVDFNQPVVHYSENFLGFPPGSRVPLGFLDRARSAWVPADDGRVVKVLSHGGGLAELDVDGSDLPASAEQLAALGITDEERGALATLHAPGQSLWRVRLPHFTAWDANWVEQCDGPCPEPETDPGNEEKPGPCEQNAGGSIIRCSRQVLAERLPVVGAPFSLYYSSDQVEGRLADRTLRIPLTTETPPTNLVRIEVDVSVAGQTTHLSYPAGPSQVGTFQWDGRDGNGHLLAGDQAAQIQLTYVYPTVYTLVLLPSAVGRSFGIPTGIPSPASRSPMELALTRQRATRVVSRRDARDRGLGAWTPSIHHQYSPRSRRVRLGTGVSYDASEVLRVVAGREQADPPVPGAPGFGAYEGISALGSPLFGASALAAAPDGGLYVYSQSANRIRRIDGAGLIQTVAGSGSATTSGDGGPALAAGLEWVRAMAVGPEGSLYLTDGPRIRRVDAQGVIETVAGNGEYGAVVEGPAVASPLDPWGLAVGPDGSVYVASFGQIAKVSPDGHLVRLAGAEDGTPGFAGDGGQSRDAEVTALGLALGDDGAVYHTDVLNQTVRRIDRTGVIETVAGDGTCAFEPPADGARAREAPLCYPREAGVGGDGSLMVYSSEPEHRQFVTRISPEGYTFRVAGGGDQPVRGGAAAPSVNLGYVRGMAVGPEGNLFVVKDAFDRQQILVVERPLSHERGYTIGSPDGREVYRFDGSGYHLSTSDGLTGAPRYQFRYDGAGRLARVVDQNGLATEIERDGAGQPVAIVAPGGQRTTLAVDAEGYLASVANPAGETTQLSYHPGGLLATLSNPRSQVHTYSYDGLGRLQTDTNPAGGSWAISRTDAASSYTVSMTTAEGRSRGYQTVFTGASAQSGGAPTQVSTDPGGLVTTTTRGVDGVTTSTGPTGMVSRGQLGPDPRFGTLAPIVARSEVTTPSGLTRTTTRTRSAAVDPADPAYLLGQTDTVSRNGRTWTSTYDAIEGTITRTSAAGRQRVVHLDEQGRVRRVEVAGLEAVEYTHDARGRVSLVTIGTGAEAREVMPSYDARDRVQSVTDPLERTFSFAYDEADRVTRQALPGEGGDREVLFSYDPAGNLASLTPPGQAAHSFDYTPVDLEASYTPPELASGPTPTQYTYNLDKQLTLVTRPDGQTVEIGYDAAGRVAAVSIPGGLTTPTYDPVTGQVQSVTGPYGEALSYQYDGALLTEATSSGTINGTVSWAYDNDFRVEVESAGGVDVGYGYDDDGLVVQAGELSLERDPQHGAVTATAQGAVNDTRTYTTFGELESYTATWGSDPSQVFQQVYTRDKLGRITKKVETVEGTTTTYEYGYDAAGRLAEVKQDGSVTASYLYDANGNRTSVTTPLGTTAAAYDAQDRLVSYGDVSYTYTANGELATKTDGSGTTTYLYDVHGNLLRVELPGGPVVEYVVDARNRRIGKKVNGALVQGFLYRDQLKPVVELDGTGAVVSRYTYGTSRFMPDGIVQGSASYRVISDHLGSPRLVIDTSSGAIVQRMSFDEWGQVNTDDTPGLQPFGFAGGLYDRDTGLVRFGARDYDPSTGRWTTKEPLRFRGSLNFYAYTENDPINFIDPTGLQTWVPPGVFTPNRGAVADSARETIWQNTWNNPAAGACEVGALICQRGNEYAYSEPFSSGRSDKIDPSLIDRAKSWCESAGGAPAELDHSHPDQSSGDREIPPTYTPSPEDVAEHGRNGIPFGGIITPDGGYTPFFVPPSTSHPGVWTPPQVNYP